MAAPAGAQPTGEQALLNKTKAAAAERRDVGGAVDGAWALLNRASARQMAFGSSETTFSTASFQDGRRIDGRHALLGTPRTLTMPGNPALK